MKKVVLDSCIFLKQFLDEEDSDLAINFLNSLTAELSSIIMPELAYYEIFSVAIKEGLQNFDEITSLLQDYENSGLAIVRPDAKTINLARKIIESGNKKSGFPSFYDAIYHAIAIEKNCDFVTSDKKHFEKTKNFGHIRLLSQIVV